MEFNAGQGPEPPAGSGEDNRAEEVREVPRPVRIVRYGAMGYVGEFSCKAGVTFHCGARVVVQTERGIELGEPIGAPSPGCGCDLTVPRLQYSTYVRNSGPEFGRPRAGRILRRANEQDIREHNHLNAHVREEIDECAALAHQLGLDMKIITAEHLLGGERIVFYFASPTRVDFRGLVKELAQRYRTRIEMRQVGARDEARLVADYEVCGRECCCKNFLKKLRPVNMKMAKLQKSTLDPSKVSGRCGRLRCCLRYEHVGYEELANRLPRVGSRVDTEYGPAVVLDRQILTQLVSVRVERDDRIVVIPLEEIRTFDLPPAPPRPVEPAAPPPAPPDLAAPQPEQTADRIRRRRRRGRRRSEGGPAGAEAAGAAPRAAPGDEAKQPEPPSGFVSEEPPAAAGPESPSARPPGEQDAPPAASPRSRRRRGRRRRRREGPPPSANPPGPGNT